jgi:1,4-alpha-glucan branching enzyme
MPGDEWQRFANMRLLFSYMFTHPGTKLLFMGGEIGQTAEWGHDKSLDWHLLQYPFHQGLQKLIKRLNQLYKDQPALYHFAFDQRGFEWLDYSDAENSVIAYVRKSGRKEEQLIVVCNLTPAIREHYRIGVPIRGQWKELFTSDETDFGGSGIHNAGSLPTAPVKYHGKDYSISLTLPPLAVTVLKLDKEISEFELEAS